MSNYRSAIKRIQNTKTLQDIRAVSKGLDRVYQLGFFTDREFTLLDHMVCDRVDHLKSIGAL
jgi:hypothetical protein